VATSDVRPRAGLLLESAEIVFGLAGESHKSVSGNLIPQRLSIEFRMVTLDIPGPLQNPDPAQAGWCGNPNSASKLDIGHSTIGLEFGQNLPVDIVEAVSRHESPQAVNGSNSTRILQLCCASLQIKPGSIPPIEFTRTEH
jgi:hypothetical protein